MIEAMPLVSLYPSLLDAHGTVSLADFFGFSACIHPCWILMAVCVCWMLTTTMCVGRAKKVNETPAFAQVSKGNSEEDMGGGGFFVTQADTE